MTHKWDPWLNGANFNFKWLDVTGAYHMSDLKKFSRFMGVRWAEIGWLLNGDMKYVITGGYKGWNGFGVIIICKILLKPWDTDM